MPIETSRPVAAGVVTALVGFTSAFVVVLQGLTAVGATHAQAASGLRVGRPDGCLLYTSDAADE